MPRIGPVFQILTTVAQNYFDTRPSMLRMILHTIIWGRENIMLYMQGDESVLVTRASEMIRQVEKQQRPEIQRSA